MIEEIFTKPLVKTVAFQVRFPSLLFLESRIGDFQIRVMNRFPDSSAVTKRSVMIANVEDKNRLEELANAVGEQRMWQFESAEKVRIDVAADSLALVSSVHKTYALPSQNRFRDAIEFVLKAFVDVTQIPMVKRIGLRYINECPVPDRLEDFDDYYNTGFPLLHFGLATTTRLMLEAITTHDSHRLRYQEAFSVTDEGPKYAIDLDAFTTSDTLTNNIMENTDKLHTLVSNAFRGAIKDPVLNIMRGKSPV